LKTDNQRPDPILPVTRSMTSVMTGRVKIRERNDMCAITCSVIVWYIVVFSMVITFQAAWLQLSHIVTR